MINQEEIHNQCFSNSSKRRIKALKELESNFSLLPDKQQAWNDLIKLTMGQKLPVIYWANSALHFFSFLLGKQIHYEIIKLAHDEHMDVATIAASVLCSVFFHVPDKQQAWNDLHKLTNNKNDSVRHWVASTLAHEFSHMPDKQQAWNDLIKLTNDQNSLVKFKAADALNSVFSQVPNKQQMWNDLINLTSNQDSNVRSEAASILGPVYSDVPDKKQVWNDLINLTSNQDSNVRSEAASILGPVFSQVPDKQQVWNDLHRLTSDQDSKVRSKAAHAINFVFSQVPDKQQVWNDLHRLTSDQDSNVRSEAAHAINFVFSQVPDKEQAWNDLHRLTSDQDSKVRSKAAHAINFVFSQVPDKEQAWNDLHRLTSDQDSNVRSKAAHAINFVFSQVPDKEQAWNDLHRLTSDQDSNVRFMVASTLGSLYSDVLDKHQAWNDLLRLTNDQDSWVRTSSNHSLGKVYIFKASQAEKDEDYKQKLEKAITFFEKAAQESPHELFNPAQFCLPFYRSFHTIVFKKQEAKEEVNKYLAEAKDAIRGSKSKEMLFEAVENLANALKEVQDLEKLDLEAKKGELNFYRQYCDRAAELMRYAEETAPFATITLRKGLPILDRNLKELLEEIQKKAKIACKGAKGTDTEEIACAISKEVQKWEIGSQEEMTQNIEDLIQIFRLRMPHLEGYEHIFEEIEGIRNETDLVKQYKIVSRIVGLVPMFSSMPDHVVQDIKEIKEKTTSLSNEFKYLQRSVDRLIESVDELQNPQEYLDAIQRNLEEIKNDIPEMKGKIDEVLYELYSPLSTTQKLKVAVPIIPLLVSYELETDVPRFVADRIGELKNLVLRIKKSK